MKIAFYKKIFLGLIILLGLLSGGPAKAEMGFLDEPIVPCGGTDQEECNLCHLWELGDNIIRFITFNLALPVGGLLFVIAGFYFLVSGGNEKRIVKAKSIFTNTVVGLVIIFCSWLLIDSILQTIAAEEFSGAWEVFPTCQE